MYSVFAVDDEPIVLEGIRSKIDWEGSGFTFAGEATDGEIALSMIHEIKPDILITDIKMPFMDGLQLAEAIKRTQPWIKIIILSGHDEFDYAKKAISIGIEDYLLKPFTPDELLTSLNKTASQIDKERKQLSDISRLRDELKSSEALIKKEFLNNLVHGSEEMSTALQKSSEPLRFLPRAHALVFRFRGFVVCFFSRGFLRFRTLLAEQIAVVELIIMCNRLGEALSCLVAENSTTNDSSCSNNALENTLYVHSSSSLK